MALLRCLGSKQMRKLPSGFSTMAIEFPQSVGSSTKSHLLSMSSNSFLTLHSLSKCSQYGLGGGGVVTGVTVGSTLMW